jgi:uncharacterized membrane protein
MKTNTSLRTIKLVQLALFTAIIVLMAFTPLGYIKTAGLSITLLVVPVTVGAITLGPGAGAILGGVFGITSFIQCFGLDPFGATLLSINPIGTFVLCLIPRILMGWLSGLIFRGISNFDKKRGVSFIVVNLAGPILNTIFFMTTFVLFFYQTEYIQGFVEGLGVTNVVAFVLAFVGFNGLIEAVICFAIGTAVSKSIDVFVRKSGM